jgi:hypothetical protein
MSTQEEWDKQCEHFAGNARVEYHEDCEHDDKHEPGAKFDAGKPAFGLVDPWFLLEMAAVMTYGAEGKYAADNWRKGLSVIRNLSAAGRHILRWSLGERNAPDSGLHHLAHAAVDLSFCAWTAENLPDYDDRWVTKAKMLTQKQGK